MEFSSFAYADKKGKGSNMECEEAVYSNDYYDFIMEYILETRSELGNSCSICPRRADRLTSGL